MSRAYEMTEAIARFSERYRNLLTLSNCRFVVSEAH